MQTVGDTGDEIAKKPKKQKNKKKKKTAPFSTAEGRKILYRMNTLFINLLKFTNVRSKMITLYLRTQIRDCYHMWSLGNNRKLQNLRF